MLVDRDSCTFVSKSVRHSPAARFMKHDTRIAIVRLRPATTGSPIVYVHLPDVQTPP
jgi:hypothetical protein